MWKSRLSYLLSPGVASSAKLIFLIGKVSGAEVAAVKSAPAGAPTRALIVRNFITEIEFPERISY